MRALLLLLLIVAGACSRDPAIDASEAAEPAAQAVAGCLAGGEGRMEAALGGALEADIAWSNAQMECDGELRPDGLGLRLTVAGPLQTTRRLRFVLGIEFADAAAGPAQALPTNLTVIVEGEELVYATRGSDKCAVEDFTRTALQGGAERVSGRGYCIDPAGDLAGGTALHVPTFSFTALVQGEVAEVTAAAP